MRTSTLGVPSFDEAISGDIVTATAPGTTGPNVPCRLAYFSNMDASIIVTIRGVDTAAGGVTIPAGETRGPFFVNNLNRLRFVSASGTPTVGYLVNR